MALSAIARGRRDILTLEQHFDASFASALALREKQIQQSYRPVIGVHKWFARRPGTVFRSLLLSEFNGSEPLQSSYWRAHSFTGVIADPFMGGGTPVYEAARLGFGVVAADINPMAYWVVRQSLGGLDLAEFKREAVRVADEVDELLGAFYLTKCLTCHHQVPVKYFLWVKQRRCLCCNEVNDLFPGYLLAENVRHPAYVLACRDCGELNELRVKPTNRSPASCKSCGRPIATEGNVRRQRARCHSCGAEYAYAVGTDGPPEHRMWAIEYHCTNCSPAHQGRFFKRPDSADLALFSSASDEFARVGSGLPIPADEIPTGDETARLHRWGYRQYREIFNARQLLGLGLLLRRVIAVPDRSVRHALATVFSDFIRYQNMLCRYDTYSLKCQDIFSVHGFPVGLVQCENNLLGISRVGSGGFRHFVEKYVRAKQYCVAPFETRVDSGAKKTVRIVGESIDSKLVNGLPDSDHQAWIQACHATAVELPPNSLDGVFTDPPYFDNVQYAELMDFCYVWLRKVLATEFHEFEECSTRTPNELTANATLGRGIEHFTNGLSEVFCHYSEALKEGAPFVFTYHHNDPEAYVPIVVAVLDAGLTCTATLPVAAEMGASMHIAGTNSSILDTVFVCRRGAAAGRAQDIAQALRRDAEAMESAGVRLRDGDLACLSAGHAVRAAIGCLAGAWDAGKPLIERITAARHSIAQVTPKAGAVSRLPSSRGRRRQLG